MKIAFTRAVITVCLLSTISISLMFEACETKKDTPYESTSVTVNKKTVKILSEIDCIVRVDGEEILQCKAGVIGRIYLAKGKYYLEFVTNNTKEAFEYEVYDTNIEDLLRPKFDKKPLSTTMPSASTPLPAKYSDPFVGKLILVKGGSFEMGSNEGRSDEKPKHQVTIDDFYIGETEVTQAQWRKVMGDNPSAFNNCGQCPVEQVSWDDVIEFIGKLNRLSGGNLYRLPTEAEWEYAAKGGKRSRGYKYAGSNNPVEVAWYYKNSGDALLSGKSSVDNIDKINANNNRTQKVKTKAPNELGLYDMSGNVGEWCSDYYDENNYINSPSINPHGPSDGYDRVFRGGAWFHNSDVCSVSFRGGIAPRVRTYVIGFRLVKESNF